MPSTSTPHQTGRLGRILLHNIKQVREVAQDTYAIEFYAEELPRDFEQKLNEIFPTQIDKVYDLLDIESLLHFIVHER